MSDDQVGCEWVSVSSGTGLPGLSRVCVCVCVCVCVHACARACVVYATRELALSS